VNFAILSVHIFLPIIGGILLLLLGCFRAKVKYISRSLSLVIALTNFFISALIILYFDHNIVSGFQFIEKYSWFLNYDISYHIGIDNLSIYFLSLTTFLTVLCIITSFDTIKSKEAQFYGLLLILQGLVIGVFCAIDIILFYIFFETVLIPMFLIIGIWGGENRIYASFKFFLYTLAGSLLFLLVSIYLVHYTETGNIELIGKKTVLYDLETQKLLWLAFFVAFAVKIPMWPLHTWLPDAHVQAPTVGSVMLAGVLLKMGGYGFLRFSLPMLPDASIYYADFMMKLSMIAIVYTSIVALMQIDLKKMIAYSSIAHMGYVTAGIFTFTKQGIEGAIFNMISHGLVSGALFLCVGFLYQRTHTKEIALYGGLTEKMPNLAMLLMVFTMASIGLPLTSGFIGELFVMFAVFKANKLYGLITASGMVLGAAYMLWLYARVMFGPLKKSLLDVEDLIPQEKIALTSIALLIILFGIMPDIIMTDLSNFTDELINKIKTDSLSLNFITTYNVIEK
jgi:NADH-quinone oxidoreductase subunit M